MKPFNWKTVPVKALLSQDRHNNPESLGGPVFGSNSSSPDGTRIAATLSWTLELVSIAVVNCPLWCLRTMHTVPSTVSPQPSLLRSSRKVVNRHRTILCHYLYFLLPGGSPVPPVHQCQRAT
ncbi:UNVERIFIED_CONTAM: hypothetical protein FKN15_030678 [Acipenser sinensis]